MHIMGTVLQKLRQPRLQQRHAREMARVDCVKVDWGEWLRLVLVVIFLRYRIIVLCLLRGDGLLLLLRDLLPYRTALVEVLVHAEVRADARAAELYTEGARW